MISREKSKFLLLILSLILFISFSIEQNVRTCIRVIDGDTIVLDGYETVRLIGVDTPETKDPRKPVQFFGEEAYKFTQKLVEGKKVFLEFDQTLKDKYGRTLAYVFLEDGTFVNAEIIKQGYGFAYTEFPFKYMEQFRQYEREARQQSLGLWGHQKEESATQTENITVYITRTGTKYHMGTCSYLRASRIPISLKEACARGYTPCSRCNPPKCR